MQLYWDEFLRHFRLCDKEDSGLSLTKTKTGSPPKSPKAHTKTNTSSQENFWNISKQFLIAIQRLFFHPIMETKE